MQRTSRQSNRKRRRGGYRQELRSEHYEAEGEACRDGEKGAWGGRNLTGR